MSRPDPKDEVRSFPDTKCIFNTQKAILVLLDGEKKWIPMSIIHEDSEVWVKGDEGTLVLPEWFCKKEKIG